jgi:hypothetical protein
MQKKTFNLIVGISGGVAAIAEAVVAFINPAYTPAIVASIGVAEAAVVEICSIFLKTGE